MFETAPNVSDHMCAQNTHILTYTYAYTHRHMYNTHIQYVLAYLHKHVHTYKLLNSYKLALYTYVLTIVH